jgi:hypothetical protein
MSKKESINVQGTEIRVITSKENDYISLSDMANAKEEQARAADVITYNARVSRHAKTIVHPGFNRVEFHTIKNADGRLVELNKAAIMQMRSLVGSKELR